MSSVAHGTTTRAADGSGDVDGATIVAIEAIPVRLPMRRPDVFVSGRIDVAENVLVRVHSESGLCGQAEAQARPYTYGGGQASIVAAVRDQLGPRLLGHSALRTEPGRRGGRAAPSPGGPLMLFLAEMEVALPPEMDPAVADDLKAREKAIAQELQRDGRWVHLWRVAGRSANVSVFDVASPDELHELHELLSGLPLFPYMDIQVTALARHPSALDAGDSEGGETDGQSSG